jgi:tripartite-type tricarboxylate transporter receptor subunit TctC
MHKGLGLTLAAVLATLQPALAQDYPSKNVTMVVPFPPGGGTDTGARIIAQNLTERWKKPVIVENKPGAAGNIGADFVAKARPDGHTLLVGNIGTQAINPSLYKNLPFDPDKAFAPVSLIAELPLVLVVNPQLQAKTLSEVIALAKSRPEELSYGTSGNGGSMHLAAALFEDAAALKLLHVPYKGGGPAIQDVIGGHIQMSFATVLETISFIKNGRLRAIGVTSDKRSPALPDVPTLAESGLPNYNSVSWIGVLAPAGTAPTIVESIAKDLVEILTRPDVREKLVAQGAIPVGSSPAEFAALIVKDRERYARIIVEKNVTAE